jgi:hypothetical protein
MNIFTSQFFFRPVFLQGDFSQLPFAMQATFVLVALGTAYAVWVLVLRDRIRNPARLSAAERQRLDALARTADLGPALPGLGGVLDRINVAAPEDERAYTAVQCYERGLVAVSLRRERWQAEAVVPYSALAEARAYAERDVTGLRAALLGPFAFWVQMKLHFLGLVTESDDGETHNFVFQGRKHLIARLAAQAAAQAAAQKIPRKMPRREALTGVS